MLALSSEVDLTHPSFLLALEGNQGINKEKALFLFDKQGLVLTRVSGSWVYGCWNSPGCGKKRRLRLSRSEYGCGFSGRPVVIGKGSSCLLSDF